MKKAVEKIEESIFNPILSKRNQSEISATKRNDKAAFQYSRRRSSHDTTYRPNDEKERTWKEIKKIWNQIEEKRIRISFRFGNL